ncbi:MAG: ATP-binding cassette domain-containing protein [Ktedonobacteraceae bacterium]|nr:ATP-binding cassette domain-containing protein [Ktedonobacteraceae bacterium]
MLQVDLETHLNTFHLSLSFSAEPGKTTVLLGESGSGKTTVLRVLAGLLHPQHGRISLDETLYFDSKMRIVVPPQQRPFGYVFQDYVLFPHLSVFENVAFGLRAQHLSRSLIRQRVGEALDQVHLNGFDQRRPMQLSGGQQQRVAIARALALQPVLLLLDEPLSALDVQTRREVRHELRHILAEVGITTILVTHQYLEALVFGQQILVLDAGKVVQRGEQRDLLTYPRSSYVAELIGINFFRGHLVRQETNALYAIQLQNGAQSVEIIAALKEHLPTEKVPTIGEDAYVIVDPRSITLYQNPPESSARNVFRGEIVQMLRLGLSPLHDDERVRVSILLNESMPPLTAEITETSAARMQLHDGKIIYASFKATEASVYT